MAKISQLIHHALEQQPDKLAFTFEGRSFSYQGLNHYSNDLAKKFQDEFSDEQAIAFCLPNGPELIACYLACFQIGKTPIPLSSELKMAELLGILEAVQVKHFVLDKTKAKLFDNAEKSFTFLEKIWQIEEDSLDLLWDFGRQAQGSLEFDTVADLALILHTSGTSGLPKGVGISDTNLYDTVSDRIEKAEIHTESTAVMASSLAHSLGLYQTLAYLCRGAFFVLLPDYETQALVNQINRLKPSHLIMVVSAFRQVLEHPDVNQDSFVNIKFASLGADKVSRDIQIRFYDLTGKYLFTSYGMTELSWILINKADDIGINAALGREGKDTEITVRDSAGSECSTDEIGELWARGNKQSQVYITQEGLLNCANKDGWIESGDLVYKDSDNLIWFAGRKKDLIVLSSGDNIAPIEVENVIQGLPEIEECIVVGVPTILDTENGNGEEEIWAFLDWKSEKANMPDLLKYLDSHLSDYKHPKKYVSLDMLDNGLGKKVSRLAIKRWCIEHRDELTDNL